MVERQSRGENCTVLNDGTFPLEVSASLKGTPLVQAGRLGAIDFTFSGMVGTTGTVQSGHLEL